MEIQAYSITEADFHWVRKRIKTEAGIDISPSKIDLVTGRISRRLRTLGFDEFSEYRELLESGQNQQEASEFVNILTTNVTSFFREPHHFDRLKEFFLEENTKEVFRVWSAGCSSGEEPYSIAMALSDVRTARSGLREIKVLGTDIDTQILEQARRGIYPIDKLPSLESSELKRCFLKGKAKHTGSAKLKTEIMSLVAFRKLNLMNVWPFKKTFDCIFCRNVMIYFDKPTRDKLVTRFAGALNPGGRLFIGHSEAIDSDHELLEPLGQTVYRRRGRG